MTVACPHLSILPRGARVGLLGGSFDPPHAAHAMISHEALRRFGLDRVVWLVSPGNPLKPNPPASLERRLDASRRLIAHARGDSRVLVSGVEAALGTRATSDTLAALRLRRPDLRFVWLMGADNLAQFHRWKDWRAIMHGVPVGVLARPGYGLAAGFAPAARTFRNARLGPAMARRLPMSSPPAWCFVTHPLDPTSSTALRAQG